MSNTTNARYAPTPSDAPPILREIDIRRLKAKDPVVMLTCYDKLSIEWRPYLTNTEVSLLMLIFSQTVRWGRTSYLFSYSMLENGNKNTPGTGLSKDRLIKLLNGLHERGFITKNSTTRTMEIVVQLDWKAGPETSPTPKRRNKTTPKALPASTLWEKTALIGSVETTNNDPIGSVENTLLVVPKIPLIEQEGEQAECKEQAPLRHPSGDREGFPEIVYRQRPTGERPALPLPARKTIPPVAPAPLPKQLAPSAIEATFRRAFDDTYKDRPGAVCPAWTRKDYSIAKTVMIGRWSGKTEELHEFVRWSVTEWEYVVGRKFQYRTRFPAPEMPDIKFLAKEFFAFLNAFEGCKHDEWLKGIDDREERRYLELTTKLGKTPEEAQLEIAENRAVAKLRKEMAQTKAESRAMANRAKAAEDRMKRMRRIEPHPESEVAKKQRAAEEAARLQELLGPIPEILPSEIDFTQFVNVPFES